MKRFHTFLFAFTIFGLVLSACGSKPGANNDGGVSISHAAGTLSQPKIDLSKARSVKFENMADADAAATIIAKAIQAKEDQATANNIFHNLMKAERKTDQIQLMEFTMSDKPVDDGLMLFSLKSSRTNAEEISFQMFEENSYQLVAANKLAVQQGNNYTALNVKELSDGKYVIRFEDKDRNELLYKVEIKNKNIQTSVATM